MNVSREHVKSDAPPQRIGRAVFGERLDEHQQRTDGIVAGQQQGENFPQPLAEARTKDRAALLQTRRDVPHRVFQHRHQKREHVQTHHQHKPAEAEEAL